MKLRHVRFYAAAPLFAALPAVHAAMLYSAAVPIAGVQLLRDCAILSGIAVLLAIALMLLPGDDRSKGTALSIGVLLAGGLPERRRRHRCEPMLVARRGAWWGVCAPRDRHALRARSAASPASSRRCTVCSLCSSPSSWRISPTRPSSAWRAQTLPARPRTPGRPAARAS